MTARQTAWASAAQDAPPVASALFTLLAQPSASERGHVCDDHAVGFSRAGRRGFKCGVCSVFGPTKVLRWIDEPVADVVA